MTRIRQTPQTEAKLRHDLTALGVNPGSTLTVHSSLSAIGWVLGGPPTVVRALLAAVGENGTLAMPAATPHGVDPSTWSVPEIPEQWLDEVRDHLPVFDRATTPTGLGAIPETFRTWPGTLRSDHPVESVCARGPLAEEITAEHPLAFSEGPGTPFGRLHEADSQILLIGVGFNRCTALHYAETLVEKRRTMPLRFPTLRQGQREWVEVPNVADDNNRLFPLIGERFLATGRVHLGSIGAAAAMLFSMQELVEFATEQFETYL